MYLKNAQTEQADIFKDGAINLLYCKSEFLHADSDTIIFVQVNIFCTFDLYKLLNVVHSSCAYRQKGPTK